MVYCTPAEVKTRRQCPAGPFPPAETNIRLPLRPRVITGMIGMVTKGGGPKDVRARVRGGRNRMINEAV